MSFKNFSKDKNNYITKIKEFIINWAKLVNFSFFNNYISNKDFLECKYKGVYTQLLLYI